MVIACWYEINNVYFLNVKRRWKAKAKELRIFSHKNPYRPNMYIRKTRKACFYVQHPIADIGDFVFILVFSYILHGYLWCVAVKFDSFHFISVLVCSTLYIISNKWFFIYLIKWNVHKPLNKLLQYLKCTFDNIISSLSHYYHFRLFVLSFTPNTQLLKYW